MAHDAHAHAAPGERLKPQTKAIWNTFWILLAATAVEFAIAFTVPAGTTRVIIFVVLTIFKAFFIVAEFMHLKHETKSLMYSIILPLVFVGWALVAFLMEGSSILEVR